MVQKRRRSHNNSNDNDIIGGSTTHSTRKSAAKPSSPSPLAAAVAIQQQKQLPDRINTSTATATTASASASIPTETKTRSPTSKKANEANNSHNREQNDDDNDRTKKTKYCDSSKRNPFLMNYNDDEDITSVELNNSNDNNECFLEHVLQFTSLSMIVVSNPKILPKNDDDDDDDSASIRNESSSIMCAEEVDDNCDDDTTNYKKLSNSLQYLIEYLHQSWNDTTLKSYPLAPSDIALLLLPWSIKQILLLKSTTAIYGSVDTDNTNNELVRIVFQSLASSLLVLLHDSNNNNAMTTNKRLTTSTTSKTNTAIDAAINKILTQSCLYKLVPKIGLFAIDEWVNSSSISGTESNASDMVVDDEQHVTSSHNFDESNRNTPCLLSFRLLTRYVYRPTIDVALKSMLLPMIEKLDTTVVVVSNEWNNDDNNFSTDTSIHEACLIDNDNSDFNIDPGNRLTKRERRIHTRNGCDVLYATFQLIQSIYVSRKMNPKTVFQLFASKSILLACSKAYYDYFPSSIADPIFTKTKDITENETKTKMIASGSYTESSSINDNQNKSRNGRELIRHILFDCLFRTNHHCQGFYTTLIQSVAIHSATNKKTKNEKDSKKKQSKSVTVTSKRAELQQNQVKMNNRNETIHSDVETDDRMEESGGALQETSATNLTVANDDDVTEVVQNSNKKFQAYQEEFLTCVQEMFVTAENDDKNEATTLLAKFLPVLLQGFYDKTIEWDQHGRQAVDDENKSKEKKQSSSTFRPGIKKSLKDDITSIQFELFARWVKQLLSIISTRLLSKPKSDTLQQDGADNYYKVYIACLESIRGMLQLILQYNIYTPSQDSTHKHQYKFLAETTAEILKMAKLNCTVTNGGRNNTLQLCGFIPVMQTLVQLNHTLLHEHTIDVIALCVTNAGSDTLPDVKNLLVTLVDTYRMLRQPRHVFLSFLEVVKQFEETKSIPELRVCVRLMQDDMLASKLALAVQSSPIFQVKEMIETIRLWISGRCEVLTTDIDTTSQRAFDFVVALTIITFRSVRVDSSTSMDIVSICREFQASAIQSMLSKSCIDIASPIPDYLLDATLTLTGWLLELNSRCAFWIGRKVEMEIPLKIQQTLDSAVTLYANDTSKIYPFLGGLQLIAYYRIRQLHSLIHDHERFEHEDPTTEVKSSNMASEASRIASFICRAGDNRNGSLSDGVSTPWVLTAQCFHSWISYANEIDVVSFLRRMLGIFVQTSIFSSDDKVDSMITVASSNDISREEEECVFSLLQDMSFYDHWMIASLIQSVALNEASDHIAWVFARCSGSKGSKTKAIDCDLFSTPHGNASWRRLSPTMLATVMESCSNVGAIGEMDTEKALGELHLALKVIRLVNSIPDLQCTQEERINVVDVTMRLDHASRSLLAANDHLAAAIVPIVIALRSLVPTMVSSLDSESVVNFLHVAEQGDGDMLFRLMKSVVTFIEEADYLTVADSKQLLEATGQTIHQFMLKVPPISERSVRTMSSWINESPWKSSNRKCWALTYLCKTMLESVKCEAGARDDYSSLSVAPFWQLASRACNICNDASTTSRLEHDCSIIQELEFEGMLLVADLSRMSSNKNPEHTKILQETQLHCIKVLSDNENVSETTLSAVCYVVGSLVRENQASKDLIRCTLDFVLLSPSIILLKPMFVNVVSGLHGPDLESVLSNLLEKYNHDGSSLGVIQDLILLMIQYLKDPDQIEILEKYSQQIFVSCLVHFHPYDNTYGNGEEEWSNNIRAACLIYDEFIRRREIYTPKERNHALLLSYMNSAIRSLTSNPSLTAVLTYEIHNNNAIIRDASIDVVFASYANLLATMFNRYSKQLYTVVPSVISLYYNMFRAVIYDSKSLSFDDDKSVVHRGTILRKICELLVPHRDVYKKHVVGLVLEFVRGLEKNTLSNVHRRESLIPAVYFLLDTMSSFEMEQLNSSMSVKAKALFKPIYSNYEKFHVYKGQ